MEDDITFGASVWGAPDRSPLTIRPVATNIEVSPEPSSLDTFDDFDNFNTPAETIATSRDGDDDDFGDFGDFGDIQEMSDAPAFGEAVEFSEEVRIPSSSGKEWEPVRLDATPSRLELQEQIDTILGPLWATDDMSRLTDEDIRQVDGLNQILVTSESRQLYRLLLPNTPPALQPVNWTRSRIRRQHLISLGIPVNLDEVLPRTNGKLPTLEISTRPMSAPPAPRPAPGSRPQTPVIGPGGSRVGTPQPGTPQSKYDSSMAAQLRLGPKPELDHHKMSELLRLDSGSLTLLPVDKLESISSELKSQTENTSSLLTYLLQMRDALQHDSETYNKLIGELVGEAQRIKTGKRTAPIRRGSGMV
ncbi:hypothetical protein CERSUDRAFT_111498 [Gelatoporia subvermispora B]|uniref:Uncharacterized protein n=1 Tax=Ceriporiopsis subvermispora (strain B) TaxID=914234 RepID=M2RR50_CERS8|nr:hypothetical protein CERSUDRAFT_111498 [Gelatoporia subvermispora B]